MAVKALHSFLVDDPIYAQAFSGEAKVLGRISRHRGVVDVYDFFEADVPVGGDFERTKCMVMELMDPVEMPTLRDVLAREAFGVGKSVVLAEKVAGTLDDIYQKHGLLHRDLKPGNIHVDPQGLRQVKLTDFGVSNLALVSAGGFIGTLPYLSPEAARGGEMGFASEVYSLATVIYETMTGVLPLAHLGPANATEHMLRIMCDPHWRISDMPQVVMELGGEEVAARVDGVFDKALHKDPQERYQEAGEFAAALNTAVNS